MRARQIVAVKFSLHGNRWLGEIAGLFAELLNRKINIIITNQFIIFRIYGIERKKTIQFAKFLFPPTILKLIYQFMNILILTLMKCC